MPSPEGGSAKFRYLAWFVLSLSLAVLACHLPRLGGDALSSPATLTPLPPPQDSSTASAPLQPSPTGSPEWEAPVPGLETRVELMRVRGVSEPVEVRLVRVEPSRFDLRVHYAPYRATTVSDWQARTGASLVVNGGFFIPDYSTLGLIVADGERFGDSFDRHGGLLSVVGETVEVRSLAQFPYDPAEPLDQAVQGRPMLLYPGTFPVQFSVDDTPSRRTAVAQDAQGRLVFVVIDYGAVSLYELRDWMVETRLLELFVAFNLDGGGSSGMALVAGGQSVVIDSWNRVPSVIALYPKP